MLPMMFYKLLLNLNIYSLLSRCYCYIFWLFYKESQYVVICGKCYVRDMFVAYLPFSYTLLSFIKTTNVFVNMYKTYSLQVCSMWENLLLSVVLDRVKTCTAYASTYENNGNNNNGGKQSNSTRVTERVIENFLNLQWWGKCCYSVFFSMHSTYRYLSLYLPFFL